MVKIAVIAGVAAFVTAIVTREENFLVLGVLVLLAALIRIFVRKVREQFKGALSTESHPQLQIAEVYLIGSRTELRRGGLRGALTGGLLAGLHGAVLGSMMRIGKPVHRQMFAVKYTNGRTGTEEHEVGSQRYYELMSYVKREDDGIFRDTSHS